MNISQRVSNQCVYFMLKTYIAQKDRQRQTDGNMQTETFILRNKTRGGVLEPRTESRQINAVRWKLRLENAAQLQENWICTWIPSIRRMTIF